MKTRLLRKVRKRYVIVKWCDVYFARDLRSERYNNYKAHKYYHDALEQLQDYIKIDYMHLIKSRDNLGTKYSNMIIVYPK